MIEDIQPDKTEQAALNLIDDVVPSRGYSMVPMVGLGGSAGSVEALQDFFASVPADSGLAFAVVIHLAPEHDSILAEILRHRTTMRVVQVQQTEKIEPNVVYVIPPGHLLEAMDGEIKLGNVVGERSRNVAVDVFFRTLADTHGAHAAAVVLSGMDGDGAIGIKRIKERGGLTVVQDPEEAMHDSMPRGAIATGMIDWVLPVGEMASRLIAYFALEPRLKLPSEKEEQLPPQRVDEKAEEDALRAVLTFVQGRTGRDFSCYKRATVLRRIARRMQVNSIDNLTDYLSCLRVRPAESAALVQDLLISVTNFFRDPACFSALEHQFPAIFANKTSSDVVRVWVVAVATGEEAFSLAIMLSEYARNLPQAAPVIQVFATDLDAEAIKTAREGLYPLAIKADVSDELLRRYFVRELRGYRVRRELREMVLFAVHDALKDSPFSRLDLVTCRNLLIYLNRPAQERLLDTFHFALLPQGVLFLGASESVDEQSPLFSVVDKRARIYRQCPTQRAALPVPSGPGTLAFALETRNLAVDGPVISGAAFDYAPRSADAGHAGTNRVSLGETHLRLLEQLSPPSILVDRHHSILHLSANAGAFLQFKGGEPSTDLLHSVHPSLRVELRAALAKAGQSRTPVELEAAIESGESSELVLIRVVPVHDSGSDYFLVTLDKRPEEVEQSEVVEGSGGAKNAEGGRRGVKRMHPDPIAGHLDREVERLKHHLRDTVQQFEASTEELKASNEELQAMNEELRSATEELETSREELQSINEELTTVNHELKSKVDELGYANNDMQNLMDAAAIAIVFLDRRLCITRYTPAAVNLFNLIPTDIGRPLSDLTTKLMFPQLTDDAQRVLERLVPIEREVGQSDGRCYLARLLPYRTLVEDRIAGVVLAFIDITERKHGEETRMWLAQVVAASADAIFSFSPDGTILSWNPGAEQVFGYSASDAIGKPLSMLDTEDSGTSTRAMDALKLDTATRFDAVVRCASGQKRSVLMSVSCMTDGAGQVVAGASIAAPVNEKKV